MPTQAEKARQFSMLHARSQAFVIPNAWAPGAARAMALKGFEAIASTSAGYAYWQGQADNTIGLERTIAHLHDLCRATDLPVSADLENGDGHRPEEMARTIRLAAEAGVVGGLIEDSRNDGGDDLYEIGLAAERIRAASEAARSLPFPFTLTARCENFVTGKPDLADTIRRLQAYQEAGADVLFAPGLKTLEDISAVVGALDRPVNVMMGYPGLAITLDMLSRAGVKRVSVGASLARSAFAALLAGVDELASSGTFHFAMGAASGKALGDMFAGLPPAA